MKLRFIIGVIFTGLVFTAMITLVGNPIGVYIDPASIIAGILVPHILISFMTPLSEQRRMIHSILTKDHPVSESLLKSGLSYLASLKSMIVTCTTATVIVGVIGMMVNLEDTASLGPNMAVCLIVTFYASLYILAVIAPLLLAAERKLAEGGE